MLDFIEHLPDIAKAIIFVAAVVTAIVGIYKKVVVPVMDLFEKVDEAVDTWNGRPSSIDPNTGQLIKAATPAMATRVLLLEQAQMQTAEALTKIADNQSMILDLDRRMLDLQTRLEEHESSALEWAKEHMQDCSCHNE